MSDDRLTAAIEAYKEAFGSVPPLMGLPEDALSMAADLMDEAVETGVPYETWEWYEALDVPEPPSDVET
jgi:hypothetical protein